MLYLLKSDYSMKYLHHRIRKYSNRYVFEQAVINTIRLRFHLPIIANDDSLQSVLYQLHAVGQVRAQALFADRDSHA